MNVKYWLTLNLILTLTTGITSCIRTSLYVNSSKKCISYDKLDLQFDFHFSVVCHIIPKCISYFHNRLYKDLFWPFDSISGPTTFRILLVVFNNTTIIHSNKHTHIHTLILLSLVGYFTICLDWLATNGIQ